MQDSSTSQLDQNIQGFGGNKGDQDTTSKDQS